MDDKAMIKTKMENVEDLNSASENSEYIFLGEAIELTKLENTKNTTWHSAVRNENGTPKKSRIRKQIQHFECNTCGKIFLDKKDIIKHLKYHKLEKHKCTKCDRAFISKQTLTYHLKSHSGVKHECDICSRQFNDKSNMKKHRNIHLNIKNYKCKVCSKTYSDPTNFKNHTKNHKGLRYHCQYCDSSYSSKQTLKLHTKRHMKTHVENEPIVYYDCDSCDARFGSINGLLAHVNRVHLKISFECEHCSKKFATKYLLLGHISKHTQLYECGVCTKQYKSKWHLNKHLTSHADNAKHFNCTLCGETFSSRKCKKDHMRLYHGGDALKCDHCDKTFWSLENKKKHIILYHGTNLALECNVCSKTFPHKELLKSHIKRHINPPSGEVPGVFPCPRCSKIYRYKSTVDIHLNGNSCGIQCDICQKVLFNERSLIKHMERIHATLTKLGSQSNTEGKQVWYYCELCNKKSINEDCIRKHMLDHPDMIYSCKNCRNKFSNHIDFQDHLNIHFADSHEWKIHVKEFSVKRKFRCNICKKRFSKKFSMTYHIKTHLGIDQSVKCIPCNKILSSTRSYKRHLKSSYHK